MRDHESPSYRAAMVDSGRGHLLPDPHPGVSHCDLPWHRSFCNPCRTAAGLLALERNEHRCLAHREPEHCRGSSYYCDPAWGCRCDCDQCDAVRAL